MTGERKSEKCEATFFCGIIPFSIFLSLECIKILEVKSICARRECVREAFGLCRGTPYITWEIGRRYFLISNARPLKKNVGVTLQEEGEALQEERDRSALLLPKISLKTKDRTVG